MEIQAQKIDSLSLVFIHDLNGDTNEIEPFLSILRKIKKDVNKIGFTSKYNKRERALLEEIFENLLRDETSTDKEAY